MSLLFHGPSTTQTCLKVAQEMMWHVAYVQPLISVFWSVSGISKERHNITGTGLLVYQLKQFASTVCFLRIISVIMNILAVGRISIMVEKDSGYWPLLWSRAKGFSITFHGSISYLRHDYYPLAFVFFYRKTHWLTHLGVNHALNLHEIQFSIFDVQTSLWCLCICVYEYIFTLHSAWLVKLFF